MIRVNQVKIRAGHTEEQLRKKAAEILRVPVQEIIELHIARRDGSEGRNRFPSRL